MSTTIQMERFRRMRSIGGVYYAVDEATGACMPEENDWVCIAGELTHAQAYRLVLQVTATPINKTEPFAEGGSPF